MYQNPHQAYTIQQQNLLAQSQMRQAMQAPQNMNPGIDPSVQMLMAQIAQNPMLLNAINNMAQSTMQQSQHMAQSMHQSQMPQQAVQTGRFGGPVVQTQAIPQQQIVQGADASRFSSVKEEEPDNQVTPEFNIPMYVVSSKHGSYPLTKKLGIAPKMTAFNPKNLHSSDIVSVCYSVQDAAEQVSKEFQSLEDIKSLILADSVIVDDGFCVTTDVAMLTNLFQDDVKGLYKRIRAAYAEVTDINVAVMLNRIDERFTKLTNDYLKTHVKDGLNIDRFSLDFNDLLKALRDGYEDEEDDLWEHLSKDIKETYKLITDNVTQQDTKEFRFLSGVSIVSFREHSFKAGLGEVKNGLFEIDGKEGNNLFLLTLAAHVFEASDRKTFYLATLDRELFRFSLNNKKEVFVERV